jgi:hypothetical protein
MVLNDEGPSTTIDNTNNGSGGIREIQTIRAIGSAAVARFISRLATAHAAAAARHMARPAAVMPPPDLPAISAIPSKATNNPAVCAPVGRSPATSAANNNVNGACACRTTDASPAGIPTSIDMNNNPNLTTPSATPIATISRHGTAGRGTNNANGTPTSANRSAQRISGGTCSNPTSITTKLSPHVAATATASRAWRGGITTTIAPGTLQDKRTFLARPVSCAEHAAGRQAPPRPP